MPKIVIKIKWDWPDEEFWLNKDNVAVALHAYCPNTKFEVTDYGSNEDTGCPLDSAG